MKKDEGREERSESITDFAEMVGYIHESPALNPVSLISLRLSSGQPTDRIPLRRAGSD
jgi:hypothetical protein